MPKTLISYSKKEIEDMIKEQSDKDKAEMYLQLEKLRNMVINLNDIVNVLGRKE